MNSVINKVEAAIKIFRLGQVFVAVAKHEYLSYDENSIRSAKGLLNEYSQDPVTSCITQNNIEPIVDLHIIVPAYNVERYICQCVESIVNPPKKITYHLTVINDGATDHTGELLGKYSAIPEVEIITQSNMGISGARNRGLKNIKGKYVTFVDSDDWIQWDVLEEMVVCADQSNADMVEGGYFTTDEYGTIRNEVQSDPNHLRGFPWGKVYSSELFKNICFPEKYWYEDTIVEQILFPLTHKRITYPKSVYFYRQRERSITSVSKGKKKSIDSLWVLLALHKDRKEFGIPILQDYYEFILRHIHLTQNRISLQDEDVKKCVFVVWADFLNREFSEYHTENKSMMQFEKYIRSTDYGKFTAFCRWVAV